MIDLTPNSTIFVLWVIFALVMVALHRLVFKPTLTLIEERKNQTELQEQNARQLLEETKKRMTSYEEAVTQARQRAGYERERIVGEAHEQEKAIIDAARADIEKFLKEIKTEIEGEKGEAILKLRQEIPALGRAIADKLMERKVA